VSGVSPDVGPDTAAGRLPPPPPGAIPRAGARPAPMAQDELAAPILPPSSQWPPAHWPPRAESGRFRLDIEGLRAVAVVLVLLYHAELGPVHGGYIGVDVFFVVSGFLITSLLVTELERGGRIALPRFWARRARRLLPASALVIMATLLAGAFVLNPLSVTDLARDAAASATFVINIVLARRQSDYLSSSLPPSPLQHFWSLAVEEQFYLVWPLLLQLVAGYRRHSRAAVAGLVLVLWPLSFVSCLRLTRHDQPWAFFGLPTRAWELLTGAALALVATRLAGLPAGLRAVVGWAGLVTIVATAFVFGATTLFPGPAAIVPVLATVGVIVAGPTLALGPVRLLRWRPLTWMGGRSYGIYLWHWPALVLLTAALGPLSSWERAATVVASIVVAAATYRVLEDPVRHWSWLAAKARRGLVMGGGLIAASITTAVIVVTNAPPLVGAGSAAAPVVITASTTLPPPGSIAPAGVSYPKIPTPSPTASPPGTPGAAAAPTLPPASSTTVPGPDELAAANQPQLVASLRTRAAPSNLRPSVRQARNDLPAIYHDGCHLDPAVTEPPTCAFGDTASPTTVVLFGDSHAAQWFPALDDIARRHHWRLEVMTKKGCPTANISVFSPTVNRELKECDAWRLNVGTRLSAERPALIVMSSYRYRQVGAWAGIDADTAWRRGFGATMAAFRPLARQVLVLGDTRTQGRFGNGFLCAGGAVRASPVAVAQGRELVFQLDPATAAGGVITGGSTWYVQAIYRDRGAAPAGFNTSDAIAITVLP